ncbi:MAG: UDP-N-acetylmuramyl-tripeptide synthetase, partial [Chlamydiia bacterium]|nr:UDP-N-acetylmuramyl-tripeptide synthetase [Chlamydiia bacterium]
MKLSKLLKDLTEIEVHGSKSVEITGISNHSKVVGPGNLFIASKGYKTDGAQFIPEAVGAGAAAIVTDIFDPTFKQVTQIVHENPAALQGILAARYFEHADKELFTVGVTGTKGKTTTTYLIHHLLNSLGMSTGLMGTIETRIATHSYPSSLTTADVLTNHRMLREMVCRGMQAAVMEVSSHALDQGRVNEIKFDIALLTNLAPDHLDYHHTLEAYYGAKSLLFKDVKKKAVANRDCPGWEKVVKTNAPLFTYAIDREADLRAKEINTSASGTEFVLEYGAETAFVKTTLVGKHNVYNILAA